MKDRQGNEVTKDAIRQMIIDGTFCDWYSSQLSDNLSDSELQWMGLFFSILYAILDELVAEGFIYPYSFWPMQQAGLDLLNCSTIRKL